MGTKVNEIENSKTTNVEPKPKFNFLNILYVKTFIFIRNVSMHIYEKFKQVYLCKNPYFYQQKKIDVTNSNQEIDVVKNPYSKCTKEILAKYIN